MDKSRQRPAAPSEPEKTGNEECIEAIRRIYPSEVPDTEYTPGEGSSRQAPEATASAADGGAADTPLKKPSSISEFVQAWDKYSGTDLRAQLSLELTELGRIDKWIVEQEQRNPFTCKCEFCGAMHKALAGLRVHELSDHKAAYLREYGVDAKRLYWLPGDDQRVISVCSKQE